MDEKIIIDAREPDEYQSSHVAGAISLPLSELERADQVLSNVDKGAQIIVYCRSGNRSSILIQILKQKGFTNLINGLSEEHVSQAYL